MYTGCDGGRSVMLICGDFNSSVCDTLNSHEILLEDRSMGIPETAMSFFKSTKKNNEAFTDLLSKNSLRFVNERLKSYGAAKATFNNGRSSSVTDYVIVKVEAWTSSLDMAVVRRVKSDRNPLVLIMRTDDLGLGITLGQARVYTRGRVFCPTADEEYSGMVRSTGRDSRSLNP
ncbi:hypothetical protein NDU88_005497 [Pleurodeles waltl]|uniref:Uncharacterized protein n=1 Tax=Pleurodeles waltl TaxID=8319 RepID=A0AAV7VLV8_PLEWA|nr:hypothetical protein NDU88_005497 [Pleurodeles waltl]